MAAAFRSCRLRHPRSLTRRAAGGEILAAHAVRHRCRRGRAIGRAGMGLLERLRLWLGGIALILRALRRCFFAVLAAIVIIVFFTLPPQGKELLALVVEDAPWSGFWWISLVASAAAVALIAWY